MRVSGQCHCGTVQFEATVEPEKVLICHCTDCQTLSGSAFRTVVPTQPGAFELTSGRLKVYLKTSESGNQREQTFCPDCGTPVYSAPVAPEPRVLSLRVGALKERDRLVPSMQYWTRSHRNWLGRLAAIPALQTQPIFGAQGEIDAGAGKGQQSE